MVWSIWATKSASVRVGPIDGLTTLPVATSKFAISDKVPCRTYSNSTRSTRPGWTGLGMQPLQRLHAGLLVGAHHVGAHCRESRCIPVGVADVLDVGLVLVGVFAFVLRGQPILALVRSQVRFAKKRSTCRGEMLSTMPRLMASRASSGGVQCDTGTPLCDGCSQANAMIAVICSGVNFGGAPHRSSSMRIPMMSFSR